MWIDVSDEEARRHFDMGFAQWEEYTAGIPKHAGEDICPMCEGDDIRVTWQSTTELTHQGEMHFRCSFCRAEWRDTYVAVERKVTEEGNKQ